MLTALEKKVAEFMAERAMLGPADSSFAPKGLPTSSRYTTSGLCRTRRRTGEILLAVSGGADSTALLYVMSALKKEGVISGELMCAHINHQLRAEESDEDEEFVVAQAKGLKATVTTRRMDVRGFAREKKLSIETAARQLRLDNLAEIAKANNCRWIATGHQRNDNAETILQRLSRGTGFRGLCGIWPVRVFGEGVSFVRPLLCVGRDEIIEYLKNSGLQWREDRTNTDYSYRRNYIRHQLLPALQRECGGSVVEQLSELSEAARKFYSLVCGRADEVWGKLVSFNGDDLELDSKVFGAEPAAVKVELVRRGLGAVGCGEGELTQGHYERIMELAEQKAGGKEIELPEGFVIRREYGKLILAKKSFKYDEKSCESIQVKIPGRTKFGRYSIEAKVLDARECDIEKFKAEKNEYVEWFDFDEVKEPVVVRFRRAGDRFFPLGLESEKKVGKFLTAEKIPYKVRSKAVVAADEEKIIWVWPVRISEKAKVTGRTQKILELQITEAVAESQRRIR